MIDLSVRINGLLAAAVLIIAFSILFYIALHNWRNAIARALCVLLFGLVVVNGGDVLIGVATTAPTINFLMRMQWLGIALVPAAYLHLSDALLRHSLGHSPPWRRLMVMVGYALSILFFVLALETDWLVQGPVLKGVLAQFGAGPLFWLYVVSMVISLMTVLWAILKARSTALTPSLRRRMSYLGASFFAPALGVFPYLIVAGVYRSLSDGSTLVFVISSLVNAAVAVGILVMTYSAAFQGMLLPDRLIKHDFVRWFLYGPVVGITIILFLQVEPLFDRALTLPEGTLSTFGVMLMTVLMPILVSWVKPYIDTLIHMQDQAEIEYLRALPRHTFTRSDLRQLLENTLIAVCGALRVDTGFVVGPDESMGIEEDTRVVQYTVKAVCGGRHEVKRFVNEHRLSELMAQLQEMPLRNGDGVLPNEAFMPSDGFLFLPLRQNDGTFIGALAVGYSHNNLTAETRRLIGLLAHQMEMALGTVHMQQRLFDALRGLEPEMASLQQLNSQLEQATPASLANLESEIALQPEFPQLVKDALTHYWGGPKLSDSPLLSLRAVRRQVSDHGGSPTRALQAVLRQAIANMRPDDQLDPSAQEWLLYNILELRFLQGKRIRDIANRLAMSESDLYRKQRIAIEEVARQLALMEDVERP